MGSVYPHRNFSGTKLITNITHLPAVPVAGLQATGSRPLAGQFFPLLWPLAQTPKSPQATPATQHLVFLQLADATTSSGSPEDLPRPPPVQASAIILTFRV